MKLGKTGRDTSVPRWERREEGVGGGRGGKRKEESKVLGGECKSSLPFNALDFVNGPE